VVELIVTSFLLAAGSFAAFSLLVVCSRQRLHRWAWR